MIKIPFMLKKALKIVFFSSLIIFNFNCNSLRLNAKEVNIKQKIAWDTLRENIRNSAPAARVWDADNNKLSLRRLVNGSYADIDYDSNVKSFWPPFNHLTRLQNEIQTNYRQNRNEFEKNIKNYLIAFNYYLTKDPISYNWWFNKIGAPRHVAIIAVYLYDYLPENMMVKVIKILDRAQIGNTGQNRIWLSSNVFYRAVITKDVNLAKQALKNILAELKFVNKGQEGVQFDDSFHQHGAQQQFGNYGLAYTRTMAYWLKVLNGTAFFPTDEQLNVLRSFMLHGQRWVCFDGYMEPGSCGRQFYPDNLQQKTQALLVAFRNMAQVDKKFQSDYQAVIDSNELHKSENIVTGNRYFYRSDYMIHRRKNFIYSVKMCSNRVIGAEAGNGENLLGYYLADGVSWFTKRGFNWYNNLFPVMDWRLLPGATIPQKEESLKVLSWNGYKNSSDFVGGLSDGEYGLASMYLNRDGVSGLKSYFFFDNEAVFLGSDLKSQNNEKLATTVQQCLVDDSDVIKGREKIIEAGDVGYVNLSKDVNFTFELANQKGSWKRIFLNGSSDEELTKTVMTIKYLHNDKVNSYAYAIINNFPNQKYYSRQVLAIEKFPFAIVANNKNIQGVMYSPSKKLKILQLVFKTCKKISTDFGEITVSQPCLLMIKKSSQGIFLTVADPVQKLQKLEVTIDAQNYEIALPQNNYTGKSVTLKLK